MIDFRFEIGLAAGLAAPLLSGFGRKMTCLYVVAGTHVDMVSAPASRVPVILSKQITNFFQDKTQAIAIQKRKSWTLPFAMANVALVCGPPRKHGNLP